MKDKPVFSKLLKKFDSITTPSFHKETLLHTITHNIAISGPPVHSHPHQLALVKLSIAKAGFSQMISTQ